MIGYVILGIVVIICVLGILFCLMFLYAGYRFCQFDEEFGYQNCDDVIDVSSYVKQMLEEVSNAKE